MEELITTILNNYGQQLWFGFITLFVTGFIMILIRQLIANTANYFRARMSDIGFGQRIYWDNQIYMVEKITFRHIVARDDKRIVLIPIDIYMGGVKYYPLHRFDDFDEEKYHQKPWDGLKDRRK